jgi:hypothetical protein
MTVQLQRDDDCYIFDHHLVRAVVRRGKDDYGKACWLIHGQRDLTDTEFWLETRTLGEARQVIAEIVSRETVKAS